MAETLKAKPRREKEGFFENYIKGNGIDIGCGRLGSAKEDIIDPNAFGWDIDSGDATFMDHVQNEMYDYVYSSHCLEHISNPYLALKNWWRILKKNGYLILYLPHRDLYEKSKKLPSKWNGDHKFYILPYNDELPYTIGLSDLIDGAIGKENYKLEEFKICNADHTITDPSLHSNGEYSIEVILKKLDTKKIYNRKTEQDT